MVDDIIRYENGEMTDEDEITQFFQKLMDTDMIYHLPGCYQRTAQQLFDAGLITL